MAALMIHGVPPGPTLVNDIRTFWGFVASMYVGNLMLHGCEPAAGRHLRAPAAHPVCLSLSADHHVCVIGVSRVAHSIVDVWIMDHGCGRLGLKKFSFDPAPLVLGSSSRRSSR